MRFKTLLLLVVFLLIGLLSPRQGSTQYYFGRNKIQYDRFQWNILRTAHLDVYFYPEMEELAKIGASLAEEAYSRLEGITNHNLTKRVPLIFYSNHSHFQQTNTTPGFLPAGVGGFFEFIKGRVVIPSTGSLHAFKKVINHEMVHVFTRSKMNRIYKDHNKTLFPGLPLWFTEGIADYWASNWNSEAEMFIRDAVLSGYLVPISQMDRIYGSFLMYKEGQAICKYIAENFGEEKLIQLYENAWKESSFSDVMKLTIGLNYKEFDEKWIYDLKKKKYPLLEGSDSPSMITRRITREGVNTKPAVFTKDNEKWVAFTANRLGYSNIYAKPLNGSSKQLEVLVKGERTPDFEAFYLLMSKLDVNDRQQLTFISKSGARDALYVFDIEQEKILKKFIFPDLVSLASPSWSPDNMQIAFSGINFSGLRDIYVVDAETGTVTRLTDDFFNDRDPVWSPDGSNLAFSSDRSHFGKDGFSNLFAYNIQSGRIFHLTQGRFNDFYPAWSPDGERIAFTSDRDGAFNVWMIENKAASIAANSNDEFFVASLTSGGLDEYENEAGKLVGSIDSPGRVLDLPSAIDKTDRIKQITHFTTGAQDPEWVGNDTLLFTTFQDFSFQINEIDSVKSRFDAADFVENDTLMIGEESWAANQLAGEIETTTISYKKDFELDIAQSAIAHDPLFGTTGGAQLAMSDMLGNQRYYFLIYNYAQTRGDFWKSWNVAVTKVDLSRRVNYAYGGYRIAGRYYDLVDSFFQQRSVGGFVSASYPFSVFHRVEGSINLRHEKREYDVRGQTVNGLVATNTLSYVKDNSLWGATGPIDGERFNFTVGHTLDIQNNDVSFVTVTADYRKYFRVGRRSAYAVRALGRFNLGKESFRYFMGGSWDLRLYPRWRIWGRKLFLLNQELRFPFMDRLIFRFPFGGLGFSGFQGATFLDFGQAWDSNYQFNEVLGSLGFGLRLRLGGFLVLRYEFGRRFQVRDLDNPDFHLEDGIKQAFWFGFDF